MGLKDIIHSKRTIREDPHEESPEFMKLFWYDLKHEEGQLTESSIKKGKVEEVIA